MRWTPEKVELLRANYEKHSNKELAEMLGVTRRSVEKELYRLRIIRVRINGKKGGNWKGGVAVLDRQKYDRLKICRYRHGEKADYYRKKDKCYRLVYQALKKGILKKEPCVVCEAIKVEGHHEDYDKPLDVIWLCRKHHIALGKGWIKLNQILDNVGNSPTNPN